MTKVAGHKFDPAYEVHLALYQAITGTDEEDKTFKHLSPEFFDLIVIDECHRGSADEDAQWQSSPIFWRDSHRNDCDHKETSTSQHYLFWRSWFTPTA